MQKTPGLVNETPKTQVERPGPVFIGIAILLVLVAVCILSAFIIFFIKNDSVTTYRPVPSATATLDPTSAALATNATGSTTPKPSPTAGTAAATSQTAPTQAPTQTATKATF